MLYFDLISRRSIVWASMAAAVSAIGGQALAQGFDLQFDFGTELSEFSASQLSVFDDVEATYESFITGYQPGVSNLTGAVIDVSASFIDGPLNFTTGTGATAGLGGGSTSGGPNGGFQFFAPDSTGTLTTGTLTLDEDDLGTLEEFNGALFDIIFHEVAHALGFGTLWAANGLVDASGQYIGEAALAAYQAEFDPDATVIPTDGTTAFNAGHWQEGSLLGSDILSPALALGGNNVLSLTTQAAFVDLGFTIIPEPATAGLLAFGGLALLARRRGA